MTTEMLPLFPMNMPVTFLTVDISLISSDNGLYLSVVMMGHLLVVPAIVRILLMPLVVTPLPILTPKPVSVNSCPISVLSCVPIDRLSTLSILADEYADHCAPEHVVG